MELSDSLDQLYHSTINSYSDIIRFFSDRNDGKVNPSLPVVPKLLGNQKLFNTFASLKPNDLTGVRLVEWNPLSQRSPLQMSGTLTDNTATENRYVQVQKILDSMVINTHELIHVMLWEPFFTGFMGIKSSEEFVNFSLLAEGFAFFHTDVMVTPLIQERFPDGDFLYGRRTVSLLNFNVAKSFEQVGLNSNKEILELFLNAFSGAESEISNSPDFTRATALAVRLYTFHNESIPSIRGLYNSLKQFKLFTKFFDRFCRHENLPKLLPKEILSSAARDPKKYFHSVLSRGLNHIDGLTEDTTERIKARRKIQSRAYYTYQILDILNNDLLIGPDTAKQRKNYFVDSINMYLNHLDNCLDLLVRNEALSEINDCILDADKFYERNVRAKFLKFQLWVSDRPHILIQEKTGLRMLSLGIQGAKKGRLSTREALKIITHLINRHINSMQLGNFLHERKSTLAIEELISFEKKLWKSDGRPSKRLCQEFIRVLKCPDQLKMWSIELSEFDPLHNQFRELLFVYE